MNSVLIVDDSKLILEVAKKTVLDYFENIEVVTEELPLKAKELLQKRTFSLIITDIEMPDLDGIGLLKWIKTQKHLNSTKVIMFSSINDSDALSECFSIGAYDYIVKPFDKDVFLARVKHAINEFVQSELIRKNFHELISKNNKLEDLNIELKKAQSELIQTERLASIGYLAAGMAHEINNPLGYVVSNFSMLRMNMEAVGDLYETVKAEVSKSTVKDIEAYIAKKEEEVGYNFIRSDFEDVVGDIKQGLGRIEEIIVALRNFSLIDSNESIEPVSVVKMLENIMVLNKDRFEEKMEISFYADISTDIVCNKADCNLSFLSILNNAYEAIDKKNMVEKGKLQINAVELEEQIVITIEDNGIGMNEETRKHSMDPFFTTKDIGMGAGLGLSSAYNCFVKFLKGDLNIESEFGVGTKVTLKLPKERR